MKDSYVIHGSGIKRKDSFTMLIEEERKEPIDELEFKRRWKQRMALLGIEHCYDEKDESYTLALGIWKEACKYKDEK